MKKLDLGAAYKSQEDFITKLRERYIGHRDSCVVVAESYIRYQAGLHVENRPPGIFLCVGPTGSGKTHLVQRFAKVITNDNTWAPLRIDCAEFSASHEVAKLVGCFAPGTPILMADGSRKPIEQISIDDFVLSGQGVPRKVEDAYEYQCDENIVEVRVAGNAVPMCVTPGHMIWAKRGWDKRPIAKVERDPKRLYNQEGFAYILAGDLHRGDVLCYPRFKADAAKCPEHLDLATYLGEGSFEVCSETLRPKARGKVRVIPTNRYAKPGDLARLLGYYVSEGGHSKDGKGVNFTFGLQEQHLVDDVNVLLRRVFGDALNTHLMVRASSLRLYASSRVVAAVLSTMCGDRVDRKRLPEWLLHAPDAVVWEFLDAVIMGDGGKTVKRRIDYSTVSLQLASQMELLIRRLGFVNQFQQNKPSKASWRTRYRLYISGTQLPSFVKHCRFLKACVDVTWDGVKRPTEGIQRNQGVDANFVYARVRSVKVIPYKGPVYDFTVAEEHQYVALSALVSNSPAGYLGHRETPAVLSSQSLNNQGKPSVVLFDEIDKAHPKLLDLLLGILDVGTLRLGDNSLTDFSNTFIFMTANTGAREMQDCLDPKFGLGAGVGITSGTSAGRIAEAAVRKALRPELFNRLDKVLVFEQLTAAEVQQVSTLELARVEERILKRAGIGLTISPAARQWIAISGYEPAYGARHLKRVVENSVAAPIAGLITSGQITRGMAIRVDLDGDKLVFYSM